MTLVLLASLAFQSNFLFAHFSTDTKDALVWKNKARAREHETFQSLEAPVGAVQSRIVVHMKKNF